MKRSTRTRTTPRGLHAVPPCRAAVVPPDPVLRRRSHPPSLGRDRVGWQKLNPGQQALLVLAHLRKGETLAGLAAGFGVGTATAWRYVTETTRLLAARGPEAGPRAAPREAGRARVRARRVAAAGLITLADMGYIGAGSHVLVPYRGRGKPPSQKAANSAHARLRAPGERANAQLKTWHILRKLRCCPWKAGQIAKAIHVLQTREIGG
jgi:hypothetical protein